jgi:bifunctional DNA-binding transcriptional regulator/antitoxin component of YhaV-PrlF toxin-antitoxin module
MSRTFLQPEGQLTLPIEIQAAAHLEEGDSFEVELVRDVILLRPLPREQTDPSRSWFWTPEWQAGEREASAEIAAGRTIRI